MHIQKLQQRYDDKKYIPSSEEAVKFKESTIKLELESMADSETENGWKITPLKKMEVREGVNIVSGIP